MSTTERSSIAAYELAALAVRVAEAKTRLDRWQGRSPRNTKLIRLLAGLIRDFEAFFAAHGGAVDTAFEAAVRHDLERLGETVLHLQRPVGRA